jgi:preprotein translocase subunit SecY
VYKERNSTGMFIQRATREAPQQKRTYYPLILVYAGIVPTSIANYICHLNVHLCQGLLHTLDTGGQCQLFAGYDPSFDGDEPPGLGVLPKQDHSCSLRLLNPSRTRTKPLARRTPAA